VKHLRKARLILADSTSLSLGTAPQRSLLEWERAARELLDEGQNFLAHDVARAGLRQYPDSFKLAIFGAVALSQTGAVDEARKLLQPVLDVILIDEGPFHRLHLSLKAAVASLGGASDKESLAAMAELAEALELVRGKKLVANADAETYTALAGVFREAWVASGDRRDLDHCRELSLRAYHTGGTPREGIAAAVTSWLLGDTDQAKSLARDVANRVSSVETDLTLSPEERYQLLITVAVAHLLLGETEEALASFAWASTLEGIHYSSSVQAIKQVNLLQSNGLAVPPAISDIIKPPTVVVFTGHPLDRPGDPAHFPPELESSVRAEIARSLDELGAQIGYSMASCGSDLLFIEAMLERGAEVNVVMPYAIDDFVAENVRYGGSRWEMRFRNALKLANTVTYATEERYLGHELLYRFANQCLHGLATLRANFLTTAPYLLAVWDMMPGSLVGGAADFIDQWEDIARLRIIDLDGLLQEHPDLAANAMPVMPNLDDGETEEQTEGRVIRSMMFCDIAGYSRLKEEHTPVYLEFLRLINQGMRRLDPQPIAINTWGDAIFAVMDKATAMAEYAQLLQDMVAEADEQLRDQLPHPLSLRISLHAGPVFQAMDPICGRPNFYGSHINRAARLEPVTVIGHVYATEQFVAVLTAEQSAQRSEAQNRGDAFEERFACEYVGVLSLAKDFGKQAVYHLRRRTGPGMAEDGPMDSMEEVAPLPTVIDDDDEGPPAAADHEEDLAPPPGLEGGFSEADMEAMLAEVMERAAAVEDEAEAEAEPEEPPLKPLVFGTVMSEEDIAALLEEVDEDEPGDEPEPSPLEEVGTGFSEADMDSLLAEAGPLEDGLEDDLPPSGEPLTGIGDLDFPMMDALDDAAAPVDLDAAPLPEFTSDDLAAEELAAEEEEAVTDEDRAPLAEDFDPAAIALEEDEPRPSFDLAMGLGGDAEGDEEGDGEEEDGPLPAFDRAGAFADADMDALLAETAPADDASEPLPDFSSTISDDDMNAILADLEVAEDTDDEPAAEEDGADSAPLLGIGTPMSDDDIAALLEEVVDDEEAAADAPAADDLPPMADEPAADEPAPYEAELDPDMQEVAAAVRAAMARLDAEEGPAPGISLAPPKEK
jgi:class 3 adenylate cyclase